MTFETLMNFLRLWEGYYVRLLAFLELFDRHFADRAWLGLKEPGAHLVLESKGKKSVNYPNDLVVFIPNRSERRASRHAPRPLEVIVGLTALSEVENIWVCHVYPKLPPAFQELLLRRLDNSASVADELWQAFREAVLDPLSRVLEGRRASALVKSQFNDHLWKLNADWTRISLDWIIKTKRVAYEQPNDALWQHVVCLFQEDPETVNTLLGNHGRDDFNVIYAYADLPPSSRGDAAFRAKFLELARSETFIRALQHPLFHTGPNAHRGVVAAGPVATPYERAQIVALGTEYGCHNCGHRHPQPKWAHVLNYWILDHQPPRSKNFLAMMVEGFRLVRPIMDFDFDNLDEKLEKVLAPIRYVDRDGNDHELAAYVKNNREALLATLQTLREYTADHSEENFYRFFLHCHDCAGLQGGIMQSIVKIWAEIAAEYERIDSKKAKPREIAYYLQCIAQLHDLLSEALDPARPLIRLGESIGGPCSIDGSAAAGTTEQRGTLVKLSASLREGGGEIKSALGFENRLLLKVSGAACHSCRATVPVPGELWTADHVSPSFLIELGLRQGPQILYPQCVYCRKAQSVLAAGFKRCWLASGTAEEWDANWQKIVGVRDDGWIDPRYADEDEELLDDTFDFDEEEELPMTGGAAESPTVTRAACLRQDMNTCGQRAAYNALALAALHADAEALQAALRDDDALRDIGPMHLDIDDNAVRDMLDDQHGEEIAIVSSLARFPVLRQDVDNCADDGERALRAFMEEERDDVTMVLNTLAPAAGADGMEGESAKVGHYIAVRLVRADGEIHATYCDSLLNAAGCGVLIQQLVDALTAPMQAGGEGADEALVEQMDEEVNEQAAEQMDDG
jgi:hypothetical protein